MEECVEKSKQAMKEASKNSPSPGRGKSKKHSSKSDDKDGESEKEDDEKEEESGEEEERRSKVDKIMKVRGFDTKTSPKPEKYNMKPELFEDWKELFVANMVAMDHVWENILSHEALMTNTVLKPKDITDLLNALLIDESIHKSISKMLHVNLLMYTKEEASQK